jgi:hypothetical protein
MSRNWDGLQLSHASMRPGWNPGLPIATSRLFARAPGRVAYWVSGGFPVTNCMCIPSLGASRSEVFLHWEQAFKASMAKSLDSLCIYSSYLAEAVRAAWKKENPNRGPHPTSPGLRPQHPKRGGTGGDNAQQHGTQAAAREQTESDARAQK